MPLPTFDPIPGTTCQLIRAQGGTGPQRAAQHCCQMWEEVDVRCRNRLVGSRQTVGMGSFSRVVPLGAAVCAPLCRLEVMTVRRRYIRREKAKGISGDSSRSWRSGLCRRGRRVVSS
ncbi:hypothetical protein BDP55DRAFT_403825 [Colletotrichum godetiae]|uniref:Uncharacterized protein n=1 Tax=Colletotrichum godetiae TaxID=1209918 RepID=A0AAJ0ER17_9PEZI|nr:uncharacterized protein BDP55DRAFT_403825 [Colletotrichum godetiae]KAK1658129.1 hypothetical protein BDP55DRAFT_403825 [Colletotrichum godetiae]